MDGVEADGVVPVTDSSVLRGDGCFEVIRSYSGRPLPWTNTSLGSKQCPGLDIPLPGRDELRQWIEQAAASCGDCVVRVVVTRGSAVPGQTANRS